MAGLVETTWSAFKQIKCESLTFTTCDDDAQPTHTHLDNESKKFEVRVGGKVIEGLCVDPICSHRAVAGVNCCCLMGCYDDYDLAPRLVVAERIPRQMAALSGKINVCGTHIR